MSVDVKMVKLTNMDKFVKINKRLWRTSDDVKIVIRYIRDNKTQETLTLDLKKEFETDGASRPDIVACIIDRWRDGNDLYNVGPVVHDALYAVKGKVNDNESFTREEVDDFLRCIWRMAGVSRLRAGLADLFIGWFGGGSKHWGNDNLDNAPYISMTIER